MSERDDRYARDDLNARDDRNDLPSTTAEFRATPDTSASTAQFKAFAAGRDSRADQSGPTTWPEQPWSGEAPARGSGRTAAMAVGAIIVIAIVITIVVLFG